MIQSKTKLREQGIAITRQRSLILKSMLERKDHPDAETVFFSLHACITLLSLDTVYRTLKLFVKEGLIQQLSVPTHRFRYDGCMDTHDHFLCTCCETIVDVPHLGELPDVVPEAVHKLGEISGVQRVYMGRCMRCVAADTPRR